MKEAKESQQLRARSVHKLLPITHVCFAGLEEMKEMAAPLVTPHFPPAAEGVPFAVEFEHRACDNFPRLDVINAFVDHIPSPPHKVNLKAPRKVVIVQLIRNSCAASVVDDFREYAKFNLRQLTEPPQQQGEQKNKGAAGAGASGKDGGAAAAAPKEDAAAATAATEAAAEPAADKQES